MGSAEDIAVIEFLETGQEIKIAPARIPAATLIDVPTVDLQIGTPNPIEITIEGMI